MNSIRRFLALVCCLCLVLALGVPAFATEDSSQALIQQMLCYYCHHQCAAKTDIFRLLEQLEAQDPETGAQWRPIMEHWLYANEEMPRNETVAPDGLAGDDSLCIVVLGYRLTAYGGMDPELEGRLEVALEAAEKYPNAYILCTGGGTASEAENVTEAGQMARWLRKQGIDSNRIIVEDNSTHTVQNANYTFDIFKAKYPQIRQMILVTSDYHLPRSSTLFFAKSILTAAEEDTEPIALAACLGFDADHEGVAEDPLDQTAHLARVAGFEYERADEPPLSQLTDLTLSCEDELDFGQLPTLTVTAHYDTGFSRDVTELCQVSGYDADADRSQDIEVSYTENGKQVSLTHVIHRPVNETQAPAPTQTEPAPTESHQPLPQTLPSVPLYLIAVVGVLLVLLLILLILKLKR